MGGRGAAGKAATAKRMKKGTSVAKVTIASMRANGNYSRSDAIKEIAKEMKTTTKQAEKYLDAGANALFPKKKKKK